MLNLNTVIPILTLKSVTKQIGGLLAVNGVDLTVAKDEIVGLVGPNGAGKTTLLNIISGITSPTSGNVFFCGEDITGLKADRICRKGIAKTFQIAESFPNLTAKECVMVGVLFGNNHSLGMRAAQQRAIEILDYVGLSQEKISTPIKNLNVIELKRIQLARALASTPKLLLLDELTTGLNPKESSDAVGLIKKIRDEGTSILIIEHVMSVIMGVSDRIVVLDRGEKIADGRPYEVVNNQRVIDTYLGDIDAF
ncbi:MAG: ABC transporter ATP-binding protein [Methanoregulaceae archaeon]|jgi:branched-chain amino acid transport system ATP-binding protein